MMPYECGDDVCQVLLLAVLSNEASRCFCVQAK